MPGRDRRRRRRRRRCPSRPARRCVSVMPTQIRFVRVGARSRACCTGRPASSSLSLPSLPAATTYSVSGWSARTSANRSLMSALLADVELRVGAEGGADDRDPVLAGVVERVDDPRRACRRRSCRAPAAAARARAARRRRCRSPLSRSAAIDARDVGAVVREAGRRRLGAAVGRREVLAAGRDVVASGPGGWRRRWSTTATVDAGALASSVPGLGDVDVGVVGFARFHCASKYRSLRLELRDSPAMSPSATCTARRARRSGRRDRR